MKPKLLVVSTSYPKQEGDFNGSFVHELSRRLAERFDVFVMAPSAPGLAPFAVMDGLRVIRYRQALMGHADLAYGIGMAEKLKRRKYLFLLLPLFSLSAMICLARVIRKEKIALIHAHWLIPNGLLCVLYKKLFGRNIRITATIHGSDWLGVRAPFLKRLALSGCDALTVVGPALKESLTAFGYQGEIHVLPMGVDTDAFAPDRNDPSLRKKIGIDGPFLLFVGALVEAKGIRWLLEAMPAVVRAFPNCRLVLAGPGRLTDDMKIMAEERNIAGHLLVTGVLSHRELPVYFAAADVFIHPSLTEGRALVVMEALSAGALCVVADIPVYRSLEGQKDFLFMVPPGDAQALGRQIITLLEGREDLAGHKAREREYARRVFGWDQTAGKYADLIQGPETGAAVAGTA